MQTKGEEVQIDFKNVSKTPSFPAFLLARYTKKKSVQKIVLLIFLVKSHDVSCFIIHRERSMGKIKPIIAFTLSCSYINYI